MQAYPHDLRSFSLEKLNFEILLMSSINQKILNRIEMANQHVRYSQGGIASCISGEIYI